MSPVSEVAAAATGEAFLLELLRAVAGGGGPPAPPGDADWDTLFALADRHKILPLFFSAYREAAPEAARERHAPRLHLLLEAAELQHRAAERLAGEFAAGGVDFVLLKGICYQELLYGGLAVRPCFDIDFLVRDEAHARKAHDILAREGFRPGQNWSQTLRDFEKLEGFHLKYRDGHEYLEYYRKAGDLAEIAEIGVKVHELSPAFTAHALARKRLLGRGGAALPICSGEDMFLCLIENFFADHGTPYASLFGSGRLRDYLDLRLFLDRFGHGLDWSYVMERLLEEKAAHKALFASRRMGDRFGGGLPPGLEAACEAAFRLTQLRAFQSGFWVQSGEDGLLDGYPPQLAAVLREYRLMAGGLAGGSRVRERLEAEARVDGRAYLLALESSGGRLRFEVRSDAEIPEDLVFSVERIVPGDDEPFESASVRAGREGPRSHRSKGRSFHSMGRLARADREGWVPEPGGDAGAIRVDVTEAFRGRPAGAQALPFIHAFSVHRRVVGDIYHHHFGDDLDFLFQSRFALLASA